MNPDRNNAAFNNSSGASSHASDSMNDLRLAAARRRLAESTGEEDAVEGLREIVANLLGSEEIGLFRVDREGANFQACWSFGIDLQNYDLARALGESGLQRLKCGEFHIDLSPRDRSPSVGHAQAFIPIRVANQTVGVLAILRLLPQKAAFDGADMELFKLLSREAAKPLFGTKSPPLQSSEGKGIEA